MLARLACHADFSILAAAEATLSGGNYRCISCGSVDGLDMFLRFCHEVDDPNEFERLFQLAGVKRQGSQAELLAIHDFSTYFSHIRHLSTTLSSSFADRHLPKTTRRVVYRTHDSRVLFSHSSFMPQTAFRNPFFFIFVSVWSKFWDLISGTFFRARASS